MTLDDIAEQIDTRLRHARHDRSEAEQAARSGLDLLDALPGCINVDRWLDHAKCTARVKLFEQLDGIIQDTTLDATQVFTGLCHRLAYAVRVSSDARSPITQAIAADRTMAAATVIATVLPMFAELLATPVPDLADRDARFAEAIAAVEDGTDSTISEPIDFDF